MPSIQQLIQEIPEYLILKELFNLYPNEKERIDSDAYSELIKNLRNVEAEASGENLCIHVSYEKDFGKSNPNYIWQACYSLNHRLNTKYSLQSLSFAQIAGALYKDDEAKEVGEEAFLAHLLYELACMDFYDDELPKAKGKKDYFRIEDVIDNEIEHDSTEQSD